MSNELKQVPENFDFEITRAINAPASHHKHISEKEASGPVKEGYADEKAPESPPTEVQSVSDEPLGVTDDRELDRAGLKAAFRFAAWSSFILVRQQILSYCIGNRLTLYLFVTCYNISSAPRTSSNTYSY